MKPVIFTIALSSLLSLYTVAATAEAPSGNVAPGLEDICSKTDFSKVCSSALVKFMAPGKNDANAALLAGLKALEAETAKAITEGQKLLKEKPTGKAAEELSVGMAVYSVVSNCTKKSQEAIQGKKTDELKKQIKLASEVTGDLLDLFQVGVGGKNDVMKDANIYIHQLAQINFNIVMKTYKSDPSNNQKKEEKEKEDEKEDGEEDDDDDDDDDEEEYDEDDDDEDEEEVSAPAPAPAQAQAPVSVPVSSPKAQPPK